MTRGSAPAERERALLELAEVAHAEDSGAVLLGREERQAEREVGMRPIRISVDEDIAFALDDARGAVEGSHFGRHELEVEHPVEQVVLEALGDHQLGADGEVLVKTDDGLGGVERAEASLVDGLAEDLAQVGGVDAGHADDAAGSGRAADDAAVVEQ